MSTTERPATAQTQAEPVDVAYPPPFPPGDEEARAKVDNETTAEGEDTGRDLGTDTATGAHRHLHLRHASLHGKLKDRTIVALAGGGVALAGGFVALVMLTGQSTTTPANAMAPGTSPAAPASAAGPAPARIPLGGSLYVTPSGGWTNQCSGSCTNEAHLISPDNTTVLVLEGAVPLSSDPASELIRWAQVLTTGQGALFSSLEVIGVTQNAVLPSNPAGMAALSYESFIGVISTNQGTVQVYGIVGVYVNSSANYAVRMYYYANNESELQSQQIPVSSMENSILAS